MPRVFMIEMLGEEPTEEMYDDPDFDPFNVPPAAFQYLPAPDLGGPRGPVRVAVRPEQVGKTVEQPSLIDRLFGGSKPPASHDEWMRKGETAAAALASAMRDLGATRAYIRFDGGNDEGFAWFDHCVFKDGSTRDVERMAKDLEAAGAASALNVFDVAVKMKDALDDVVATTWAVKLLGRGYGTGEFVMYGACSVDLDTGLATDDPNPAPVVQNIRFKAT